MAARATQAQRELKADQIESILDHTGLKPREKAITPVESLGLLKDFVTYKSARVFKYDSVMTSLFLGNRCYGAILSGNECHVLCKWHCRVRKMRIDQSRNEASANSSYYEGLDLEAKKHYDVKIATLRNLGDPYAARKKSFCLNHPGCIVKR